MSESKHPAFDRAVLGSECPLCGARAGQDCRTASDRPCKPHGRREMPIIEAQWEAVADEVTALGRLAHVNPDAALRYLTREASKS